MTPICLREGRFDDSVECAIPRANLASIPLSPRTPKTHKARILHKIYVSPDIATSTAKFHDAWFLRVRESAPGPSSRDAPDTRPWLGAYSTVQ